LVQARFFQNHLFHLQTLVKSLSISKNLEIFNKIVEELDANPVLVAVTLEEKLKCLRRKGKNINLISADTLYQLFKLLNENKFSKEAIPAILEFLSDNPNKTVKKAIVELNIKLVSVKELENIVDEVLKEYSKNKKINRPFKTIMGEVMKVARNRIDGKVVAKFLETKLRTFKNH